MFIFIYQLYFILFYKNLAFIQVMRKNGNIYLPVEPIPLFPLSVSLPSSSIS